VHYTLHCEILAYRMTMSMYFLSAIPPPLSLSHTHIFLRGLLNRAFGPTGGEPSPLATRRVSLSCAQRVRTEQPCCAHHFLFRCDHLIALSVSVLSFALSVRVFMPCYPHARLQSVHQSERTSGQVGIRVAACPRWDWRTGRVRSGKRVGTVDKVC
jgi:hypothetical protein